MKQTSYFTFGQNHIHNINGQVFDKNTVVKISINNDPLIEDPRDIMWKWFGGKWSMEYNTLPNMAFYSSGIIDISDW